jgi:amino acid transporter
MEPGEALGIAAQIAVTLAGFAGVVVVFRRESVHEWSPADKLRLRFLLTNSILPLGLCMLGLLLLTIKPMPPGIWRWCSGFAFVVSLLFAITMTKVFRRLDLRQIPRDRATRFVLSLRNLWNSNNRLAIVQRCPPRRILAVLHCDYLQLVTATFQFARMILMPPE